ncbi:MAG: chromate efflux transporter [Myxococcaceae bacterium]|nr:chromate efflux transporter [Myxococcaceae bacterium]
MEPISLRAASRVWLRIGLLSFGGPAGQIALMHGELVDRRRWISDARFLHALSFCTLLPGPEAMQLATYVGFLMHRLPGALVAGGLFVLPGALVMLALSALYGAFHRSFLVEALFLGLKAAVVALVVHAVARVAKRALKGPVHWAVAGASFVALLAFQVPYPAVVLATGLLGAVLGARAAGQGGAAAAATAVPTLIDAMEARGELAHARPSWRRTVATFAVGLALWALPLLGVAWALGPESLWAKEARLFSEAAVVTFGGAYAVLGFIAHQVVELGWLSPQQMVDGLGLAETTPGPLILVLEFVGFLSAHQHPGGLSPFGAGALGAAVTLWATFVPCFLWILAGAPWVEALRGNVRLRGALGLITAAVVGVIAQLSLWFALHTLFAQVGERALGPVRLPWPELATVQWPAAVLCAVALVLVLRTRVGVGWVLAGCSAGGLAARLLAG